MVMGAICVNDDELADKLKYLANGNQLTNSYSIGSIFPAAYVVLL